MRGNLPTEDLSPALVLEWYRWGGGGGGGGRRRRRKRRIVINESGPCGLVPDHAEPGDLLCVLFGCDVAVALQKVGNHYIFIGESYVHGILQGEAIEALERGAVHCNTPLSSSWCVRACAVCVGACSENVYIPSVESFLAAATAG
jgi:hypothetical protein